MARGLFNRAKGDRAPATPPLAPTPTPTPAPPATPTPTAAPTPAAGQVDGGVPGLRPVPKDVPARPPAPRPTALPTPARADPRPGDRRTLVVGRGITLQGTVADAERLVVEGTVDAPMIHAAELVIAETGLFKGEVEVEVAEIAGTFDGSMTVRGSLTLRASGAITGTVRCRRLAVAEGGQVSGRVEMLAEMTTLTAPVPPPALPGPAAG